MSKKKHEEEHVDETWLLPYSDMLTLLLALFIVMFAMSQVDKAKLRQFSQEFNIIFSGGSGILQTDGNKIVSSDQASDSGETDEKYSLIEQDKMAQIKNALEQQIKQRGYADKVKVDLNGEGLDISIQDTVLFNSGDAEIVKGFYPLLDQISSMLKSLSNNLKVGGHTDNVPISNYKFHSNWDLSYARAANVMNYMVSKGNIVQNKFSIEAYGEFNPKYTNATEKGRAQNRRVDILVVRNYPAVTNAATKTTTTTTTTTSKAQ